MIDITELARLRKYYFSLPVSGLQKALLYREVPAMPTAHDYIFQLYWRLDNANSNNLDFRYSTYLILKTIVRIKEFTEQLSIECETFKTGRSKQLQTPEYILFLYQNNNLIVRVAEPVQLGVIHLYFQYKFYNHAGEYLKELNDSGVAISQNQAFNHLADRINYEYWLLGRFLSKRKSKVTAF